MSLIIDISIGGENGADKIYTMYAQRRNKKAGGVSKYKVGLLKIDGLPVDVQLDDISHEYEKGAIELAKKLINKL